MENWIGKIVIDRDGAECSVTGATTNSIEVFIRKKTDRGIDCKQWFTDVNFSRRFKHRE